MFRNNIDEWTKYYGSADSPGMVALRGFTTWKFTVLNENSVRISTTFL